MLLAHKYMAFNQTIYSLHTLPTNTNKIFARPPVWWRVQNKELNVLLLEWPLLSFNL